MLPCDNGGQWWQCEFREITLLGGDGLPHDDDVFGEFSLLIGGGVA